MLYVRDTLEQEPRVFLDPNSFSEDGCTALSSYAFSKDGELCGYALSKSGSDWVSIKVKGVRKREGTGTAAAHGCHNSHRAGRRAHAVQKVRRVASGEDLDEELKYVKFSCITWTHDNLGFFYNRYDAPKVEPAPAPAPAPAPPLSPPRPPRPPGSLAL